MSPVATRPSTAVAERSPAAPLAPSTAVAERSPGTPLAPSTETTTRRPAAERHLALVPRRNRVWANRRRFVVGAFIAATAAMCLALVVLHVLMAEAQFRLDGLQQRATVQQSRYEQLRLDIAQLEAPGRIIALDEGRFGMVQPASVTYLPPITASAQAASKSTTTSARSGRPSAKGSKVSAGPNGSGPSASGPAGKSSGTVTTAPAGDADWPSIKPFLSGNP